MPSSGAPSRKSRKSSTGRLPSLIVLEEFSDDESASTDSGTRASSSSSPDDDSSFRSLFRTDGCDSFEDGVSMAWHLIVRVLGCHQTSDTEDVEQLVTLREQEWRYAESCGSGTMATSPPPKPKPCGTGTMAMWSLPKPKSNKRSPRERNKKTKSKTISPKSKIIHAVLEADASPKPQPSSSLVQQAAPTQQQQQDSLIPSSSENSLSSSLMIKSGLSAPPSIHRISMSRSQSLEFLFGGPYDESQYSMLAITTQG